MEEVAVETDDNIIKSTLETVTVGDESLPLFTTKKEVFDWIWNGQKTVDIRKGKAWKGEIAVFQCGPRILRLRIVKKEEGTLTKLLRSENFKAVIPFANSLNEAVDYLKSLYGTTECTFTAYYLEPD